MTPSIKNTAETITGFLALKTQQDYGQTFFNKNKAGNISRYFALKHTRISLKFRIENKVNNFT